MDSVRFFIEIIIFAAAPPNCTSSLSSDYPSIPEGGEFTLRCTASYTGDPGWAPAMEWRDPNGLIYDVIDNSLEGFVNVSVRITATSQIDGFVYTATTLFHPYDGNLPEDTATNIPSYVHTHTYEAITVLCE